jgi:hypothetical protein
MSKMKGWPKWLRLLYFHNPTGKLRDQKINGLTVCVGDKKQMAEIATRYGLHRDDIVDLYLNDEKLTDTQLNQFFQWINQVKREVEEYEKWKATNEKAKASDASSQSGSK